LLSTVLLSRTRRGSRAAAQEPGGHLDALARELAFRIEPKEGLVVAVTSAIQGEGKSTIAHQLSRDLRRHVDTWRPVLVVDCGSTPAAELQHVSRLATSADPGSSGKLLYRGLRALLNPGTASNRGSLEESLQTSRQAHGAIVLDLPALLVDPLAPQLAAAADAVFLVVQSGRVTVAQVRESIAKLESTRLEGVILNRSRSSLPGWVDRLLS
jgi:Mrp family chromosome partitioning ATPase